MDDTGDESKHWQMVPVAKSYSVCVSQSSKEIYLTFLCF